MRTCRPATTARFTSMVYTDLGLMTCDETIASDVEQLFEFMAGEAPAPDLRAVMAAPFTLRRGFESLVEREMAWAQRGDAGHIILKMNALIDPAGDRSAAPRVTGGRPGRSDRARLRLASSRRARRQRADSRAKHRRPLPRTQSRLVLPQRRRPRTCSSAAPDLRPRNFERRVEIVVPLKDRGLAHRVRYEILDTYLADTMSAKELLPNGRYRRVTPRPGEPGISCQAVLQR